MSDQLEMLMAREQLMEDIDSIITEFFQGIDDAELNQVTEILCDAVCRNFPAKWYKLWRWIKVTHLQIDLVV